MSILLSRLTLKFITKVLLMPVKLNPTLKSSTPMIRLQQVQQYQRLKSTTPMTLAQQLQQYQQFKHHHIHLPLSPNTKTKPALTLHHHSTTSTPTLNPPISPQSQAVSVKGTEELPSTTFTLHAGDWDIDLDQFDRDCTVKIGDGIARFYKKCRRVDDSEAAPGTT